MDLRTDYPFWLLDQGIIRSYPSLPHDISTEIVVMGAGMIERAISGKKDPDAAIFSFTR